MGRIVARDDQLRIPARHGGDETACDLLEWGSTGRYGAEVLRSNAGALGRSYAGK